MKTNEMVEKLKVRFETNRHRHEGVEWGEVEEGINKEQTVKVAMAMEQTGGEPDVVKLGGKLWLLDCAPESPKGRRSCCYDREARLGRAKFPPKISAEEMAEEIGVELLTEAEYRELQKIGGFDLKTSSWVATPNEIRKLGGALFCDRRYGVVFTYHNGADSYYAARGFRGKVLV